MRPELTIDLKRIAENYRFLLSQAKSEVGAVLKADAYGLGAEKIAPLLQQLGCKKFFVANLSEAIALRKILGADEAQIHIFEGYFETYRAEYVKYKLNPVLNSLKQYDLWYADGRSLKSWLHIDTGMSRLGLDRREQTLLLERTGKLDSSELAGLMTHLACADELNHPANETQLLWFEKFADQFPRLRTSIGNSAGILNGKQFCGDVARAGMGLFGGNPVVHRPNVMQPVIRLSASIQQIRRIETGEAVGYGGEFTARRSSLVATVGMGYADGIPRNISNSACALYANQKMPIIGRVSMDAIALDATDAANLPKVGDRVELIGNEPASSLDQFAAWCGTIGYEVLTNIGPRVKRLYVD